MATSFATAAQALLLLGQPAVPTLQARDGKDMLCSDGGKIGEVGG